MVLLLFFTMIFICFMVEGIVMAEDNGDENGGCKHEETIIKRDPEEGWYITDAMHWCNNVLYCVNCGEVLNSWSNTGYHDVEEKIEGHKSYCKVKEVIDCSICGHYKVLSSKTNTHIRGSKCSKCGEYYPTFEEEAEEKIEQSKGEYNNGNEIQKGAEGDEEIAEGDFIEGLETYQDADDEYEDVLSDLDEAGKLNDLVNEYMENLRKEIIYYGDAIEGFETEQYSSIYSQNKVGINIKDSEIEFDEVQEDKTIAEKISEDARQLYRDIMNFEEVNTDFLLEKNLEVNSGLDADPVKYTTGEYVSKKIGRASCRERV